MGFFSPFVRAQAQMQALPMLRRSEVNTTSYVADYLTRSVRRASGFVLVGKPEAIRTNHTKRVSSIVETSQLHSKSPTQIAAEANRRRKLVLTPSMRMPSMSRRVCDFDVVFVVAFPKVHLPS